MLRALSPKPGTSSAITGWPQSRNHDHLALYLTAGLNPPFAGRQEDKPWRRKKIA
jgi:hypothetical protein